MKNKTIFMLAILMAMFFMFSLVGCDKDKDDQNSNTHTSNYTKFSFTKIGNQWNYVLVDQNGVVLDSIKRKCLTIDNGKCMVAYSDQFGQMTEYWHYTTDIFGMYPDESKDYYFKILAANSKVGDILTNEDGIQIKVIKADTLVSSNSKNYSCFKLEIRYQGAISNYMYINPTYGLIRTDDLETGESEVLVSTNF